MKNFVPLITVFVVVTLGCKILSSQSDSSASENLNKQSTRISSTPTATLKSEKIYKQPIIGMDSTDFSKLCKPEKRLTKEDNITSHQGANNIIAIYSLGYTTERGEKYCWGVFTFENEVLKSITRN